MPTPSPGLRAGTERNLFGWLKEAFANEAYSAPAEGVKANAKHILVKSLEDCTQIKDQVESGAMTFEDAARQFSTCPSKNEGGSLGNFKPGMMVPEFDQVRRRMSVCVRRCVGGAQCLQLTSLVRSCVRSCVCSCPRRTLSWGSAVSTTRKFRPIWTYSLFMTYQFVSDVCYD